MKILTINAGSSSLKASLFEKTKELVKIQIDGINRDKCKFTYKSADKNIGQHQKSTIKEKLKSYDNYKSRALIDRRMNLGRLELDIARSKKLNIGQTLPEVEALLGEPHEKILGNNGTDQEKQLWIYFMDQRSLQLSFQNFLLFKIEEL